MNNPAVLLAGTVGSVAYGLATPGFDIDTLGVFAAPTRDLVGLEQPQQTIATTNPDQQLHEAAKYCHLALKGNPSVSELLWLPEELYTARTPLGEQLLTIRTCFLSAPRVRDAYLGFADQQLRRLTGRCGPHVEHRTRRRSAKHARHLARLVGQGIKLYKTGHLQVRVEDPEWIRAFGDRVASGRTHEAASLLIAARKVFDTSRSPLPDEPDKGPALEWLSAVRTTHWES
ncbi:hypothetical protein GCM10022252_75650 [Streptosporangium oxazolinicum]|uniref:Nucleotidyltransferase n=1 Tax=Streptosporangium oxazolinicum TaxID=909287 RepID=A0ABP8BL35_9ACTN